MQKIEIERNDHASIQLLKTEPWLGFYTQGGVFEFSSTSDPIRLGSLAIDVGKKIIIYGRGIEVHDDALEIFRIELWQNEQFDDEDFLKKTRPRFLRVSNYPSKLGLDKFLNVRNEINLLRTMERQDETLYVVDKGILCINPNGAKLMIEADDEHPSNILITTTGSIIKERLLKYELITM